MRCSLEKTSVLDDLSMNKTFFTTCAFLLAVGMQVFFLSCDHDDVEDVGGSLNFNVGFKETTLEKNQDWRQRNTIQTRAAQRALEEGWRPLPIYDKEGHVIGEMTTEVYDLWPTDPLEGAPQTRATLSNV